MKSVVKLTNHEKGDVIIVDISGKLTLGEGTSTLRKKMRELVEGGSRRILLNLADVAYIDSSGLGELVAAHTTVTTAGGEIKLLNLAKRVHDLLTITKLYTVFETFENEASAGGSFSVAKPGMRNATRTIATSEIRPSIWAGILLLELGVAMNPVPASAQVLLSPGQLDQLVSRVALYPDPLLAQVLTASTYSEQISDATRWADHQLGPKEVRSV